MCVKYQFLELLKHKRYKKPSFKSNWTISHKSKYLLQLNSFGQQQSVSVVFLNPKICRDYKGPRIVRQGKLFQKCTHLLYCSVLSLGGSVNTRRMSKPDMGSIFYIQNQWNVLVIGNYNVNYNNYQKFNAFNLLGY